MARSSRSAFPAPILISSTAELVSSCARLRQEAFVTVDTEFMREKTYWPVLCVVQLAGENEVAVVDALAEGIDLTALGELLTDPLVIKVFHAARQDVEIFVFRFGSIPKPMFDTQVAAMVAGFGDQVGYDSLVSGLIGASIDKLHQFSNWSVRPLSPAQIAYAAADVTHLRDVYKQLRVKLVAEGRLDWVGEEMAVLSNPATYHTNLDTLWERLRPRSSNRRFLGLLRALLTWREQEAQRINIPRQRLLKDEVMMEIAAMAPVDSEALLRVRGITKAFAEGHIGTELLKVLLAAKSIPDNMLPTAAATRNTTRPSPALVSLLKILLATKCEEHHVAPRLVASSEDIMRLVLEEQPNIRALHGWRRDLFGEDALALKAGRIALSADGDRIRLVSISE